MKKRFAIILGLAASLAACDKSSLDSLYDNKDSISDIPDIVISSTVGDPYTVVPASEWVEINFGGTVAAMGVSTQSSTNLPDQLPLHYVKPASHIKMMVGNVTVEQFEKFVLANPGAVSMPPEPFWGWTNWRGETRKDLERGRSLRQMAGRTSPYRSGMGTCRQGRHRPRSGEQMPRIQQQQLVCQGSVVLQFQDSHIRGRHRESLHQCRRRNRLQNRPDGSPLR